MSTAVIRVVERYFSLVFGGEEEFGPSMLMSAR
jgi:hypothetical protein